MDMHRVDSSDLLHDREEWLTSSLLPLIETIKRAIVPRLSPLMLNCPISRELVKDCILVDLGSSGFSHDDVETALLYCSKEMKCNVLLFDARLAHLPPSKLQALPLHCPHLPDGGQHLPSLCPRSLSSQQPPCVLYLQGLDLLLEPTPQGVLSPGDSPEEVFALSLQAFLVQLQRAWERGKGVVVLCSTGKLSSLSPRTLSLFPLTLSCPPTLPLEESLSQLMRGREGGFTYSEEVEREIGRILRSRNTSSPSFILRVLERVEERAVQREREGEWLAYVPPLSFPLSSSLSSPPFCSSSLSSPHPPLVILPEDLSLLSLSCSLPSSSSSTSTPQIAPVQWGDIGGLERVRREVLQVLELPLQHPHLFPPSAPRRRGVLLYGPPGTGKTLVAKAVATECQMTFLSVKGPELLDSYVGESEKNIRALFAQAQSLSPCVLFFDEIDSLAPRRAQGGESHGGVMDRIVAQLLTEIDQLNMKDTLIFLIAATNRPDLLDPALLRGGRLDRQIYLGLVTDQAARSRILEAQTRKFRTGERLDWGQVVQGLPARGVSGADLASLTSQAFHFALQRKIEQIRRETLEKDGKWRKEEGEEKVGEEEEEGGRIQRYLSSLSEEQLEVVVEQGDFEEAVKAFQPSLSLEEVREYEALERDIGRG